ncbi:MAG: hypothetical protein K1X71_03850 [Pirellulales bacterium]|nr:hypothetical protein [Pirellulales bacterium]
MKAAHQPSKRDLSVLTDGVPRTHVIAELGAPVWTEERDGGTTDVFAFKQGYSKGAKALRAMGHATADFLTAGLWEAAGTPIEIMADGTPVKVEVSYDANYYVESVHVIEGQEVMADSRLLRWKKRQRQRGPLLARRDRATAADTSNTSSDEKADPPPVVQTAAATAGVP